MMLFPATGFAVDAARAARGTHIFRRLFHMQGCTNRIHSGWPSRSVLVVLGDAILRACP